MAWSLAGGVTAGGLLVAAVTFSEQLSSSLAPSTTTVLFVLGGLAGFVHGGLLGYLGRRTERPRSEALVSIGLGAIVLIPAAPLAWLAALLVALSSASLHSGDPGLLVGAFGGWVAVLLICSWGAWEGWQALRRAFSRWPDRRAGTLVILGVLAILGLTFFLNRPVLWGTNLQVRGVGAIVLALGATIWIALPVVLTSLHFIHRIVEGRRRSTRTTPVKPESRA